MPLTVPFEIQGQDKGKRLGDIDALANAISDMSGMEARDSQAASTTQTQAGGTLVNRVLTRITRSAANDAITLSFKALAGRTFVIVNDSGNTIRLFPFLGDKINDAATNAQVDIANNTVSEYYCPVLGLWFGGATTLET